MAKRFEPILVAVFALGLCYQMFWPPMLGLADSGDYPRVMSWVGLVPAGDAARDKFKFVHRMYLFERSPFVAFPANLYFVRFHYAFLTSEAVLAGVAAMADRVVSRSPRFDLRELGAVQAAALILALALVWKALRVAPWPARLVAMLLLALVFLDSCYVVYLNSFYSEPASLIFFLAAIGWFALLVQSRGAGWQYLIWGIVASALFVLAKPQNAPCGLLLAGFLVLVTRQKDFRRFWVPTACACVALLVVAGAEYSLQPQWLHYQNIFNMVIRQVLRNSPAPEQEAPELGLSPEFVHDYCLGPNVPSYPPQGEPFRSQFFNRVNYGKVLGYYLRRPSRLYRLAKRTEGNLFLMRTDYLGNYEESSGRPPGAQSHSLALWSTLKARCLPRSIAFLAAFLLVNGFLAVVGARRLPTTEAKLLSALFGMIVLVAAAEYACCLIGEGGEDLIKHLFGFNNAIDLMLVADVALSFQLGWTIIGRLGRRNTGQRIVD